MHRTAQVQVRWDPGAERGKWAWIPPLTKTLTVIESCLQREKMVYFNGVSLGIKTLID